MTTSESLVLYVLFVYPLFWAGGGVCLYLLEPMLTTQAPMYPDVSIV